MLTCVSLYRLYLVIRSVRGQPQPSRATKTRVSITIITSFSSISNITISSITINCISCINCISTISSITVMWGFNQNAGNPTSPPLCCNLWSRLCRLVRNCYFSDFPVKREETWPIREIQILSQIFSCFLMQRKVEGVITKKKCYYNQVRNLVRANVAPTLVHGQLRRVWQHLPGAQVLSVKSKSFNFFLCYKL